MVVFRLLNLLLDVPVTWFRTLDPPLEETVRSTPFRVILTETSPPYVRSRVGRPWAPWHLAKNSPLKTLLWPPTELGKVPEDTSSTFRVLFILAPRMDRLVTWVLVSLVVLPPPPEEEGLTKLGLE